MSTLLALLSNPMLAVESYGINGGILAAACTMLLIFGIVVSSRRTRMKTGLVTYKTAPTTTSTTTTTASPLCMFEISLPSQELDCYSSEDDSDEDDPFTRSGRPRMFGRSEMVAPCRDCSHSRCVCENDSAESPKSCLSPLNKGKRLGFDEFATIAE